MMNHDGLLNLHMLHLGLELRCAQFGTAKIGVKSPKGNCPAQGDSMGFLSTFLSLSGIRILIVYYSTPHEYAYIYWAAVKIVK
jgi:hypothetical protein